MRLPSIGVVLPLWRVVGPTLFVLCVWVSIACKVPRVVHHKCKVLIVVNACRDVRVVLNELVRSDLTICLGAIHHVVVHLKCLEELSKDLVLPLFS